MVSSLLASCIDALSNRSRRTILSATAQLRQLKKHDISYWSLFPEREKERSTIIDRTVSVAGVETHKLQNDVSRLALGSH